MVTFCYNNGVMKKKTIIIIVSSLVGAIALSVAIPFSVLGIRTAGLKTDYSYLNGF